MIMRRLARRRKRRQRAQYRINARVYRGCARGRASLTIQTRSPYLARACRGGGIGRRVGFRYQWLIAGEVRVLSWAPWTNAMASSATAPLGGIAVTEAPRNCLIGRPASPPAISLNLP